MQYNSREGGNAPPKKNFKKRNFRQKRYSRNDFFLPGCPRGVKVPDNSPGSLERSLRYLKRQMKDTDVIGKFREKQEFIKPSAIKRKQKNDAIRKQKLWEKINARFWDNYQLIVPPKKGQHIGPVMPEERNNRW